MGERGGAGERIARCGSGLAVVAHMAQRGGRWRDPLAAWGEARGLLVYIGNAVRWRGLAGSIYANPYRTGHHGDRAAVIALFAASDWPRERARAELRGHVLGCWCWPEACHGDIIAAVVNEEHP